jgi:glycosyltransferase involved in cell wall biosynthesis
VKIGLVTAHASRRAAGVWVSVAQLAKALVECGLDVEIFGLADECSETDCAGWGGPPLSLHGVLGGRAFGYAPRLARSLHARHHSLLHANGLWMYPSLASFRWSRRGQRPYLVAPHGMLDPWAVSRAVWKKRLVAWWFEDAHLSGAACLHALSGSEAHTIRSYGLRNPICVIPSGVDLPKETQPAPPSWAYAAGRDWKILLFLGRLHPKKGLLNLVHSWAEVQADRPAVAADWMLVIAGWNQGSQEAMLRRRIDDLGAAETVCLAGPQFGDHKAASFARADAFVLPSFSEGMPIAVLEAWSYGLPVLMTEACNLPEGFAAGAALRIGTDRASIGAGLSQLFAMSDAARRDMGARGRALGRKRFTWASIGAQMAAVYRWVLGGGPPPSCILTD